MHLLSCRPQSQAGKAPEIFQRGLLGIAYRNTTKAEETTILGYRRHSYRDPGEPVLEGLYLYKLTDGSQLPSLGF